MGRKKPVRLGIGSTVEKEKQRRLLENRMGQRARRKRRNRNSSHLRESIFPWSEKCDKRTAGH